MGLLFESFESLISYTAVLFITYVVNTTSDCGEILLHLLCVYKTYIDLTNNTISYNTSHHNIQQAHTDRLSPAAQSNQRYAVACATLLFLLSIMVVILHTKPLLSSIILGTRIEGVIILILISFWTALVAIVSDTRHGLATDSSGSISNGNLYYFSWAGLGTGVALLTSFIRSNYGLDMGGELRSRAERLQQWVWAGE